MFVVAFDPKQRVIWVDVRLVGPQGSSNLRFILDTGTPATVIDTTAMDKLGYGAQMGLARSRLLGVDGEQEGYRIAVERLETLGLIFDGHEVFCHDLDERLGVDGLIGMDVLVGHVVIIDGVNGTITVA